MHTKFKAELTKYLHFLLKFANREEQFRKSPIYRDKRLDEIDLDVSSVPLLHIDVSLTKVRNKHTSFAIKGLNQGLQKFKMRIRFLKIPSHVYEISSSPLLEKAADELFSILTTICKQFTGVPKVETVLFKQLKKNPKPILQISAA